MPSGSAVFLFGSATRGRNYDDIDLLILYDPNSCAPQKSYNEHRAFVDKAAELLDAPIHLSVLTYDYEKSTGFIVKVSAIPVATLTGAPRL